MIVRLTGILVDVNEGDIVVDRDGVAREVLVPSYALGELAACRGREITLHTTEFFEGNQASGNLVPRILGFLHVEDRRFFNRFVSVKGIGARKALKALSEPVRRIASWIEAGDTKALSRLPGIGQRTAALIVAELRGKVDDLAMPSADVSSDLVGKLTQGQRDAVDILVAWGDTRGDAERWIQRLGQLNPDVQSADELVRMAYRMKGGGMS